MGVLLGIVLLAAPIARADTIVLKNGRRIIASNVTVTGDHISYETPAGTMSIPKEIVARIDRDNFGYTSAASAARQPLVSAPVVQPVRGYGEIAGLAVHDDSIDYTYLARVDGEARSGSREAVEKCAAAHYAAAQFLTGKGDADSAIEQYLQALVFDPASQPLLLNLAVLYLRDSQFTAALDPLERARRGAPDSADVAKLMGWAYYGANKLDEAVAEWKQAERLRPDPEVEGALAKAERDKQEEENYREGVTAHFALKYSGSAAPDLARGILRTLEQDFDDIQSLLDFTPPDSIAVILYTNQAFADITRAPSWAGAINDGRIRIPVQGLSEVTPDLARVLRHELTHSFVGQKTHMRAPTWVQEGVAQYIEGRRSAASAGTLLNVAGQGLPPRLEMLEGSWMGLSGDSASLAYSWSLAAIESIVAEGGMADVSRLLDHIATDRSTEDALRETLRGSYSDLDQQTLLFLHKEDVR
jgi:tetratricopeptide (TPR) repeat protein